jgi:7-carboxy-7-deazaguanine synthase
MDSKVFVAEIFKSFQGEGPFIGRPCIFVRFFGCNQNCKWCDSKYATKFDEAIKQSTDIKQYEYQELKSILENYNLPVVFTGGEPLLQKEFLQKIDLADVEIETNGSLDLLYLNPEWNINISPKLSNSGNPITSNYLNNLVKNIVEASVIFQSRLSLKFVVDCENEMSNDIIEITQFLKKIEMYFNDNVPGYSSKFVYKNIYLMPMGTNEEQIKKGIITLSESSEDIPFQFKISPRLHVLVFGNKRGV